MRRSISSWLVLTLLLSSLAVAGGVFPPGASAARVTISFWHAWGGYEGKKLEELVARFNATHPDVKVEPSYVAIGDKLMTAIAGGTPPDVATIWDWMVASMAADGSLQPLDTYLADSGITREDYLPGIWEYGSYRGGKFAVPTTLNVYAIFYNKDILKAAGYDPAVHITTLEQLEEMAERLTIATKRSFERIGFMPQYIWPWFWSFGGQFYDPATNKITANDPANVRALEWMVSFYRKFDFRKYRRFQAGWGEYASPGNPFYTGKIAIVEDGQWQVAAIKKYAPHLNYGVAPYPAPPGGRKNVAWVNGSFWAIPKGAKHPQEAWKFLSWLISPEVSAEWCATINNIPPMRRAIKLQVFANTVTPEFQVFLDLLEKGHTFTIPSLPVGQYFTNELWNSVGQVLEGLKEPKQALDEVTQRIQVELNKAR
ncbi:MAG: ABC transporter substrate-binding protein [Bacillota bacterium]